MKQSGAGCVKLLGVMFLVVVVLGVLLALIGGDPSVTQKPGPANQPPAGAEAKEREAKPPTQTQTPAEDPHGARPLFDQAWGKAKVPASVERAVRETLADPSSLQITKLVSLEKAEYQGVKCYQMIFNFTGRNRMGGATPMAAMAYVRDSQLLGIQFFED